MDTGNDTGGTTDTADTGNTTDTADTGNTTDTADTGDTTDTTDTADTGDTTDTTDTADTGDTTDTADTGDTTDTTDTTATDYVANYSGMSSLWYNDAYTFGDPRTWTFEFWYNPSDLVRAVRLMEWLNGGSTDGRTSRGYWVIDLDTSGRIAFGSDAAPPSGSTVATAVYTTRGIPVGTWSHVAVVVDTDTDDIRIYIDGVIAGSANEPAWFGTMLSTSHQLGLGGRSTMAAHGLMDNVRMWSVARTEAEIVADMATTFDLTTAPATLVDQFDFDADFTSLRGNTAGEAYMVTRDPR